MVDLPPPLAALGGDPDRIAAAFEAALIEARAAHPEVELPREAFATAVAACVAAEGDPATALESLPAADLWLATAALAAVPHAVERLDEQCIRGSRLALARFELGSVSLDDVLQNVRAQLFFGTETRPPKLAQYSGRGSLRGFVRVLAAREIVALSRRAGNSPMHDDAGLDRVAEVGDPELASLRARYGVEFKAAFETALARLEPRQRNLLRHQLLDQLGIDAIAALYGAHRATAARWLARAREDLFDHTVLELSRRLRVPAPEIDSVLRLIGSQLDASVTRILRDQGT
ncbi:MAG: transcriptional regulator [Polyangiaceae bacterium]|nr:transcriptional regulator [Polyangiaceae bacterium]